MKANSQETKDIPTETSAQENTQNFLHDITQNEKICRSPNRVSDRLTN